MRCKHSRRHHKSTRLLQRFNRSSNKGCVRVAPVSEAREVFLTWFSIIDRDVNRVPVNRITGYVTRDRFQLTVTDTRNSKVKLRIATPSGRPRYKCGQEADNDQKRTPHSLQTAYVNNSTGSHRSQPPTGAEHGRSCLLYTSPSPRD